MGSLLPKRWRRSILGRARLARREPRPSRALTTPQDRRKLESESNGMDAPALKGINVPKWKCVVIHLKVKGACHEAYDDRIGFGKTDIPSAFSGP